MLHHKPTFTVLLASLAAANTAAIPQRTTRANAVAKSTQRNSRRLAYAVKAAAISRLLSLGHVQPELLSRGLCLVRLADRHGLHLPAVHLEPFAPSGPRTSRTPAGQCAELMSGPAERSAK
ncbi:MAG: hypothetical protein EPN33_14380 [Acidobacteria bacterium]|nr:MAG: hypothetical protein EPN33_14380 [Acidobacteriota bacterium]